MARRSKDRTPEYATKEEEDLRQERRAIKEERNRKAIEKAASKTSRQSTTPQKQQTPLTKIETSTPAIIPPPLNKVIPKLDPKAHHSAGDSTPGTVTYHPTFPKPAQWFPDSIILEDLCKIRYHLRSSDVKRHTSHFSRQADTPMLISRWDPTHTIPIFKVPLESDIVTVILISITPYSGSGPMTLGDIVSVIAAAKEVAKEWGIPNLPSLLWQSARQLNGTPDQLADIASFAGETVSTSSLGSLDPQYGAAQASSKSKPGKKAAWRPFDFYDPAIAARHEAETRAESDFSVNDYDYYNDQFLDDISTSSHADICGCSSCRPWRGNWNGYVDEEDDGDHDHNW